MSRSRRIGGKKSSIEETFKLKCRLLVGGDRLGAADFFAPSTTKWIEA